MEGGSGYGEATRSKVAAGGIGSGLPNEPRKVPRMKHYFMSSDYFALPERKALAEVDSLCQW